MNAVAPEVGVATRRVAERTLELADPVTGRKTQLPVRTGTLGPGVIDVASMYRDHDVLAFADAGMRIGRPRQLYTGPERRDYTDIKNRK